MLVLALVTFAGCPPQKAPPKNGKAGVSSEPSGFDDVKPGTGDSDEGTEAETTTTVEEVVVIPETTIEEKVEETVKEPETTTTPEEKVDETVKEPETTTIPEEKVEEATPVEPTEVALAKKKISR